MTHDVDIVVVGGGIHGAGVAQAAAAAGWKVAVLEAAAIAAGTSSRSSKLIHGGLRYLEGGHLRLVRESLNERRALLRIAPDLVRLIPFHVPVYDDSKRGALRIRLGLSLYALLAGDASGRFESLSRRAWEELDGLDTTGLRAVFRYYDAQTDDAALTRAVMRSAQSFGAILHCPARFIAARRLPDGIDVDYEIFSRQRTTRTRVLVNAAGPWVNDVLNRITPVPSVRSIDLVQGTHIIVPGCIVRGAYYVEAPRDRRGMFVLPWNGNAMIGTTETAYQGDPARVTPQPEEIDYLREAARRYFPQLADEPIAAFAGVRVLPRTQTAFSERSRETVIDTDDTTTPRIATIYGGKLTGYRLTAQRALALLSHQLPVSRSRLDTAQLPLAPA